MTRYTPQEYAAYMSKREIETKNDTMQADEGPESKLQGKIVKYCKDKGYPCLSFRQSRKAEGFLTRGWPDCTIAGRKGKVFFLELKTATGTLRDAQTEIRNMMRFMDHRWHLVRSFKQFVKIVEGE